MADPVTIHRARVGDVDRVAPLFDLYRRFYAQREDLPGAAAFLRERLESGESVVFLALDGDTPAGFCQLYPTFSSVRMIRAWLLNDLFVHPAHRRRGVARALMHETIAHARRTGAGRVQLETAIDNNEARALYESMSFVRGEGFDSYALGV